MADRVTNPSHPGSLITLSEPSIKVHKHGFVRLVEVMGTDDAIVQAARVSYGEGTKSVSNDRALIRYLIRHRHTSPIEMCEVKFHIKLPIFVMRQLVRHRTASINEYSGRYSIMSDDFYFPKGDKIKPQSSTNNQGREEGNLKVPTGEAEFEYLKPQSQTNKQGREGSFSETIQNHLISIIDEVTTLAKDKYKILLQRDLARELARIILPVNNYTECYWKLNLHNLFHFLKLRLDDHAQKEIQDFSNVIWQLVQPRFPIACEAFDDYIRYGYNLSRMEVLALKDLLQDKFVDDPNHYGMSKREHKEFNNYWRI